MFAVSGFQVGACDGVMEAMRPLSDSRVAW